MTMWCERDKVNLSIKAEMLELHRFLCIASIILESIFLKYFNLKA